MRRDVLASYFTDVSAYPVLNTAEEAELLKGWTVKANRPEIRKRLVEGCLRFVISVARSMRVPSDSISMEDAVGAGNEGLMAAAKRYDPEFGVKFISYAVWWVRQSIDNAKSSDYTVKPAACHHHDHRATMRAGATLRSALGREPTDDELVAELAKIPHRCWTHAKLRRVRMHAPQPSVRVTAAMAQHDGFENTSLVDVLPDLDSPPPDTGAQARSLEELWERTSSGCLTPRERTVMECRNGLGGDEPQTLKEVGSMLGVTRERVRQIEDQARRKLVARHGERLHKILTA